MSKSSILTERQQGDLNKAIIQYLEPLLRDENDQELLKKLSDRLSIDLNSKDDNLILNYLEKKWTAVVRLQKRILDLESQIGSLKSVVDKDVTLQIKGGSDDKLNWIPSRVGKKYQTKPLQFVHSVAIHPSLPVLVCGCSDGSFTVWTITNDETAIPDKMINAHTRGIAKIKWSPSAISLTQHDKSSPMYLLVTCSADLSIKIWNETAYSNIRTLTGHEHTVSSIAFSEINRTYLYSVSRDKSVKIWDLVDGICVKSFIGHSDWVRNIDVTSVNSSIMLRAIKESNNLGDFVVTCSNDQSIRLSHANTGTGIGLLLGHTHVIETVKFLPLHSNIYVDKYLDKNLDKYPTIPQSLVKNSIYEENLGYKYCISAGRDNIVKLWLLPPANLRPNRPPLPSQINNSQGWLLADLIGHQSWVKTLAIHPTGRFIFSAGDDMTIKTWDLDSLSIVGKVRCISTLKGHEGFVNGLDFAKVRLDALDLSSVHGKEEKNELVLNSIKGKMKTIFISGGVDCSVNLWN